MENPFKGRQVCIATMHRKERVIAPFLKDAFDLESFVPEELNTDLLGTFSGEVERSASPLDTAREKCKMAHELTGADLVLASEGSFGRHPSIFFAPGNEEFVMLKDFKNDLEIVGRHLTTETNLLGEPVHNEEELHKVALKAGFPEHGLIVRKNDKDMEQISKGIISWADLLNLSGLLIKEQGFAFVETDMRAHMNPTRMKAIGKATEMLVESMKSHCPTCNTPGFVVTDRKSGLPCSLCGSPTQSTLAYIYTCVKCPQTREAQFPHGKQTEEPMYCDFCNP